LSEANLRQVAGFLQIKKIHWLHVQICWTETFAEVLFKRNHRVKFWKPAGTPACKFWKPAGSLACFSKTRALETCRPVIFNAGEIAPRGDFMRQGGDFVIYQIWGDFSLQGGDFCRLEYTKILNWIQK